MRIAYLLSFGIPFATWLGLSLRLFTAIASDITYTLVERGTVAACGLVFALAGYRFPHHALPAFVIVCPFLAAVQAFGIVFLPVLTAVFCAVAIGRCAAGWHSIFRVTPSLPLLAWNALAVCLALSLGATALRGSFPWQSLWAAYPVVHGFGSPGFPITNSHLWLSAWLLVRLLVIGASQNHRIIVSLPRAYLSAWIGAIGVSCLVQYGSGLPVLYNGFVVYAPFEDIHASGSVLTALMLFAVSKVFWGRDRLTWLIATILTGSLLAFSYSRGAWLGALLGISLLAAIRLPVRSSLALATAGFVTFLLLFLSAPKFESVNSHLSRLSSFVRVDRWTQTESARLQLYESAIRMIEARPWFGHGPGSSYQLSGQFRGYDDPHFLHNSVLQLAAEAGLPAGLFLILVLGTVVIRAIPVARSRTAVSANTCALTVGCVGYLGTQLTANAINIYPTQVFFFWPLFAMLWLSTTHCCEKRTRALPPATAV